MAQMVKICLQYGRPEFYSWVRKILWRRKWQPTPVYLPGKSHGQRSLAGYSPWSCKESNTTEWLHKGVLWGFPGGSADKESACNAGDPNSIPGSGRSPAEGKGYSLQNLLASLVAQKVKNLPAKRETWVWSLGWEKPLENGMATHSSILAWWISTDRGSWRATVHGAAGSDMTERLSTAQQGSSLGWGMGREWEKDSCHLQSNDQRREIWRAVYTIARPLDFTLNELRNPRRVLAEESFTLHTF